MNLRVDSHHHLWHYTEEEFGWLEGDLSCLQRDFSWNEFRQEMRSTLVDGCVAVQARQSLEETAWLLDLADHTPEVLGVVGWAGIAAPGFAQVLDELRARPFLKGLRHVVQAEPEGFLDRADFHRGMELLTSSGLVYDLLITEAQLAEAIRFVDRHPRQRFVLDHIAKPCIRQKSFDQWSKEILDLSRRENVVCKLSGMVTEADQRSWDRRDLKPYFDVVLQAFTPRRLMAGSDWPVVLAACSYQGWWQILEEWVHPLTSGEQAMVLGGTAIETYRLQVPQQEP